MKKITIMMTIFAICLVSIITVIGFKYNESIEEYILLENNLEEAASIYMETEKITLVNGDSLNIDASTLLELGFIKSLNVDDDECTGNILVKRNDKYTYKTTIKCQKYSTYK